MAEGESLTAEENLVQARESAEKGNLAGTFHHLGWYETKKGKVTEEEDREMRNIAICSAEKFIERQGGGPAAGGVFYFIEEVRAGVISTWKMTVEQVVEEMGLLPGYA